jgi:lipoprotein-releasing system permease protein
MRHLLISFALAACSGREPAPKQPAAEVTPEVLREKILAVNAHIIVLKLQSFSEWREVLATIESTAGVVAAEPFLFEELKISTQGGAPIDFALKGVDPTRVDRVLGIGKRMKTGALAVLADAAPTIVLGDVLASKLGVKVGDEVTVSHPVTPAPDQPLDAPPRKPGVFRVGGTFHMDFDEYDEKLALVPIIPMQAMMERGDQVTGIEMTVTDLAKSGELAKSIDDKLGGMPYQARDWYELNKQLLGSRRP